jgi:hypothetical protein
LENAEAPTKIRTFRLPDLAIPSGRIIAADMMIGRTKPFSRAVPPGRYPLGLVAADLENSSRIALAILRFSDAPVKTWEPATLEGLDPSALKPGEAFGYPVDSGTGSLCDASAHQLFAQFVDEDGAFMEQVSAEMSQCTRLAGARWLHIDTDQGSLACFTSGLGDGRYASFFGLDAAGKPAMLVTDFNLVRWR